MYYSDRLLTGGLAQLARAPALQAGGQRFESVILHSKKESTLTCWKQIRNNEQINKVAKNNHKFTSGFLARESNIV